MPVYQEHLIEIAVEPKSKADQEKLSLALSKLVADDPSFRVSIDQNTGQTILKGMGELHLEMKVDILRSTYKVDANIGQPQVACREKLMKRTVIDYTHEKLTGGTGQLARVKFVVEPNEPGKGFAFASKIIGGAVPEAYIPGVKKGLTSVLRAGILAGFPVVDIRVDLVDGAYHDVDSSALAFEIASRAALREALQTGGSVLLEPVMTVEVVSPDAYADSVIGDLDARHGQIQGQDRRDDETVIDARVPLSRLLGYERWLRALTDGRATVAMTFSHYAPIESADWDPFPPAAPAIALRA